MKKSFTRMACLLLTAFVCLVSLQPASAESPAFPLNAPPAFGQVPTQFTLFSGAPVDYAITLQVDEETGLRTYTIPNPLEWGLDASVPGVWEYASDGGWQRTGDAADGQLVLLLPAAAYEQEGFPLWGAPCSQEDTTLSLNIYLGEMRHLYAYVDYEFPGSIISVTAEDCSFVVESHQYDLEEDGIDGTYASYDPAGVLAYVSYTSITPGGSLISYNVDADTANQTYRLSDIVYNDEDDNSFYWNHQDGQWQNGNFEPTDAPEGVSVEKLPFTIVGDWAGIPFEQPGDKPEGAFAASALPADPAMDANQYRPWPEETDALYHSWASAGLIPALPAVSWATREDGAVVYTLTGLENWGVPDASMGTWQQQEAGGSWQQLDAAPADALTLISCNEPDSLIFWEVPCTEPGTSLQLYLHRSSMMQELTYTLPDGSSWLMDNRGGLVYNRVLDATHTLEAIYDDYTLVECNLHQSDEAGNRLSQACYNLTEVEPAALELGCFFLYSPEMNYEEALWLKDIGWYSYETGAPCEEPQNVDLTQVPQLMLK